MKTFREFLPYFIDETPECPIPVAEKVVKRILIHFLEHSLILEKNANPILPASYEYNYDLVFSPADTYRPVSIVRARWGVDTDEVPTGDTLAISHWDSMSNQFGDDWDKDTTSSNPNRVILNFDNTARLYPIPENDIEDELNLKCAVTLLQTATSVDDFVFENFVEGISKGVLSELFKQPGKSWTDRAIARDYERMYWDAVRAARKQSTGGKGETSGRVKPRNFLLLTHSQ